MFAVEALMTRSILAGKSESLDAHVADTPPRDLRERPIGLQHAGQQPEQYVAPVHADAGTIDADILRRASTGATASGR